MDAKEVNRLVYQDTNRLWIIGPIFIFASLVFFLDKKMPYFVLGGWGFVIFGVLVLLLSNNLTITADQSTRVLQLTYRFLLFCRTVNIPFDEIADIQAQVSRGSSSRGTSRKVLRLVAVLKNGKVVPFRSYFTQDAGKKKIAQRLRLFITGTDQSDIDQVKPPISTISL